MTKSSFPSAPANRRAILVLHDYDIERCAYEPGAAQALLDEETYVLRFPLPSQGDVPVALQNILDAGLARPGNLLVQSPYDVETYEEAALAPERFAVAKYIYFSTLCMHLGAKELVVEQSQIVARSEKNTLQIKGTRFGTRANTLIQDEELEKFKRQFRMRDEFAGGPADVPAAERLLRHTGLWADSQMRALIELRSGGENRLKTHKLELNLSSEAKSNFNVVGRLKVPAFVKLSADYASVFKEERVYSLSVAVSF